METHSRTDQINEYKYENFIRESQKGESMTIKTWQERHLSEQDAYEFLEVLMQDEIDELRARLDAWENQEPVGYLAWHAGKPSWDEDCVCQDAVYPVDESDVRTSEPIYTKPKEATIKK